jgi:hypothetical protein
VNCLRAAALGRVDSEIDDRNHGLRRFHGFFDEEICGGSKKGTFILGEIPFIEPKSEQSE